VDRRDIVPREAECRDLAQAAVTKLDRRDADRIECPSRNAGLRTDDAFGLGRVDPPDGHPRVGDGRC
jgi:hypothetical protein